MPGHILDEVARVVERILSAHAEPLPTTPTIRVNGPVWIEREGGTEDHRRTLSVDYDRSLDWFAIANRAKDSALKDGSLDALCDAVVTTPVILDLLTRHPAPMPCVQRPGDFTRGGDDRGWIYDALVTPLLGHALAMQVTVPRDLVPRLAHTYQMWATEQLYPFALAPLHGFEAPSDFSLRLDADLQIRPVSRADVQAMLYAHHPLASLWLPRDLLGPRHLIEFAPGRTGGALLRHTYDRGVLRALTALRLVRPSSVTVPHVGVFLDGGTVAPGGSADPEFRALYGTHQTPLMWKPGDADDLQRLYDALGTVAVDAPLTTPLFWWDTSRGEARLTASLLAAWIGMESFYGKGLGQQEMSFRLALRTALYLESREEPCATWYEAMRDSYNTRSRIVHEGVAVKKPKDRRRLMEDAQAVSNALHHSLRKALLAPPEWQMSKAEDVLVSRMGTPSLEAAPRSYLVGLDG